MLPSGEAVVEVVPQFAEIEKLPGRSIIITGLAPTGSGFDFFSRVFCPKLGLNEVLELDFIANVLDHHRRIQVNH